MRENRPTARRAVTVQNGPGVTLTSRRMPATCDGELNGFDNTIWAEPSGARLHGLTVQPAPVRAPRRPRSSSFPPPASAAFTASASSTAVTVTTPLPSSCTFTDTVVSTLHATATIATANATRTSRKRLVLERTMVEGEEMYLALGTAPGKLDGRRLDPLDRPEDDLVVERVDHDRLAGVEFLPQDLLRQRILDHPLDRPPQRPRAQRGVVALRREQQLGVGGELHVEPLALQLADDPLDEQVDDLGDLFPG